MLCNGPYTPLKVILPVETSAPPSTRSTWFPGSTLLSIANGILTGSAFLHSSSRTSLYFTMGRPIPLKLPLPMGGCGPHLIRGSLSSPEPTTQTAFRLVQPFLQGLLLSQTDRQTTLLGRLTIGNIYVRSTAMRPNNNRRRITVIVVCNADLQIVLAKTWI